ncbi:MAG TPA: efflux RND transporter periplasmic adaptor subunit [Polyangiaceae bacterium]|nr:efflux RND transporter periplasmic adaptor subunit [Polyangiaceae bacterium]
MEESNQLTDQQPRHSDPPSAELGFALPQPARLSRGRALTLGILGLGVLGGVFLFAFAPRRAARANLEQRAENAGKALARVAVAPPKLASSDRALKLPGNVQPLEEAVIYARANGYVARWLVDLGDKVKADQLLAEIETPEVNQELSQGRASLAKARAAKTQAEASRNLAKTKADRAGKLMDAGVGTQQELDQAQADSAVSDSNVNVAQAAIEAEQANIRRLSDLQQFSKVTAPFAGTITARSIDRGSLVTAGNATPLFRLAATETVRVFVQVPQDVAPSIVVGATAKITVREFTGRTFEGQVARTAGALDAVTRTLNTEIRVPNPDGKLLSGMYAEVSLNLSAPRQVYEIPATALLSDAQGLRVAIVTPANTLHLQPISIERDLGPTLQVSSGLSGNERLVQIAGADLAEGQKVEPFAPKPSASAAAPAGAPAPAASSR